ncbi:MAG: hypothetical protein ACOYM1_11380 [Methylovulum sp.]
MAQGSEFIPTDADRKLVESMSGYGVPYDQIAALVGDGIHRETLAKHFEKELIQGKAKANSKIGQTLFQKATNGDTTAMIWWSKTQMGWKETKEVEIIDKTSERKFIIERATRDNKD